MDTSQIIDGINNNISMIQPPDRGDGDGDVTNMNNSVVDLIESNTQPQLLEEQKTNTNTNSNRNSGNRFVLSLGGITWSIDASMGTLGDVMVCQSRN